MQDDSTTMFQNHLCTCSLLLFLAINPLRGNMRMTVAIPASADGPSCYMKRARMPSSEWMGGEKIAKAPHTCQRKKRQRAISMGASQTALKYTTKSMSFWVSAETRFTISPTVQVLLAALFITNDCIQNKKEKKNLQCNYTINIHKNSHHHLFKPEMFSCLDREEEFSLFAILTKVMSRG